jgi:hypothetical protein
MPALQRRAVYLSICNRYHVTCKWQPPMPQHAQEVVTSLLRSTRTAPSAINGDTSRAHRIWSGTQSARLNHSMATVVEPFEVYQIRDLQPAMSSYYSPTISTARSISEPNNQAFNTNADDISESTPTHFDGNDNNAFTTYADDDCTCESLSEDPILLVPLPEFSPRIQNSQEQLCTQTQLSQHVFNAMMERRSAEVQQSIQHLAYDIDHRNVVNLMMILEHSKCPDYLLSDVLQWAHTAFTDGFHFAPRAFTREANMSWIYKSLLNSHQCLHLQIIIELTSMSATDFIDSIAGS